MQVKSVNRSENEMRKKFALGDIKNAPLTTNLFSGKKTMMKKEEAAIEEPIEMIIASRKPVNSFDIWVEEATFSDEIVNQFIRRDIEAQNMNPYDETEPKNLIIEDDILEPIGTIFFLFFFSCVILTDFNGKFNFHFNVFSLCRTSDS